jgi:hypothetical protein
MRWWEGKESHAYGCFQHALEANPNYGSARLSDQIVGSCILTPGP